MDSQVFDWIHRQANRLPFARRYPRVTGTVAFVVVCIIVVPSVAQGWLSFWIDEPASGFVQRTLISPFFVTLGRVDLGSMLGFAWAVTRMGLLVASTILLLGIWRGRQAAIAEVSMPDIGVEAGQSPAFGEARGDLYSVEVRLDRGLVVYLHVRNHGPAGIFEVVVESIVGLAETPIVPYYVPWIDPASPVPDSLREHRARRIASGGFADASMVYLWGYPQSDPHGLNLLSIPRADARRITPAYPASPATVDIVIQARVVSDNSSPVDVDLHIRGGHPVGLWVDEGRFDLALVGRFGRGLRRIAADRGSSAIMLPSQMAAWRRIVDEYLDRYPTFISVSFKEQIPSGDSGSSRSLAITWADRLDEWVATCTTYSSTPVNQ